MARGPRISSEEQDHMARIVFFGSRPTAQETARVAVPTALAAAATAEPVLCDAAGC